MKKIVLLASIVALTALMLAAAPAFADEDNGVDCPGNSENTPAVNHNPNCVFEDNDHNNNNDNDECDDNGDDNDNGDDCDEFNVNDRDVFRNIASGNVAIEAPIDISQDIDQDCDSGDVSQPISVTGGGDNSIQTVGLQPTANTGCSQNATGVLQAAPIVAGFGGDTILNNEDNNVFNNDEDNNDVCDRDHDGKKDNDCEDADNNDDNGDNGVDFNNRTLNRIGGDRNIINGPDFGDVDVDSDSSIDVSPAMTVNGGGTINQAATASSTWVWSPLWGWMLK
jgi:hypothetical protein